MEQMDEKHISRTCRSRLEISEGLFVPRVSEESVLES